MSAWIAIAVGAVSALVGAIGALVGARVAWRRDARDQQTHDDAEADRTIELLEKQNKLLCEQIDELRAQDVKRETEWRKRETEWRQREKSLESRVTEIERDYRNLVLTVTTMGFCANAASCPDYNPGDRRRPMAEPQA